MSLRRVSLADVAMSPRTGDRVSGADMSVEVMSTLRTRSALTGVEARMTSPDAAAADTQPMGVDHFRDVLGSMGADVEVTRHSRLACVQAVMSDLLS